MRMNRMMIAPLCWAAFTFVCMGAIAQPVRYPAHEPESVVWRYLDSEFAKASEVSDYWKRAWHVQRVERDSVRLGKPYDVYNILPENLSLFLESGDLLSASTLVYVSYPVFDRGNLIGTVQVAEDGGTWGFVSRMSRGLADSVAVAVARNWESVSIVGGLHMPAFVLTSRMGSLEIRAYPLGMVGPELKGHMDEDGSVSYEWLCGALRPLAEQRLREYRLRSQQGGTKNNEN